MSTDKDKFLGMPFGTASSRLRRNFLFHVLKRHGENICYRCGEIIDNPDNMSLEHKEAWLNKSIDLFWDMENVTVSHQHCNYSAHKPRKRHLIHGTTTGYNYGCRCEKCTKIASEARQEDRINKQSVAQSG